MFDLVKKDFIIGGIFLAVIAAVIPFLTMMSVVTMIDTFGGLVLGFFIPMIIVICVGSSFIFIGIDATYGVLAFDLVFLTGLFDAIRKWVMGLSTNGIYLFIFTLLVVLTLISMGLSTRFYKKKEI